MHNGITTRWRKYTLADWVYSDQLQVHLLHKKQYSCRSMTSRSVPRKKVPGTCTMQGSIWSNFQSRCENKPKSSLKYFLPLPSPDANVLIFYWLNDYENRMAPLIFPHRYFQHEFLRPKLPAIQAWNYEWMRSFSLQVLMRSKTSVETCWYLLFFLRTFSEEISTFWKSFASFVDQWMGKLSVHGTLFLHNTSGEDEEDFLRRSPLWVPWGFK